MCDDGTGDYYHYHTAAMRPLLQRPRDVQNISRNNGYGFVSVCVFLGATVRQTNRQAAEGQKMRRNVCRNVYLDSARMSRRRQKTIC